MGPVGHFLWILFNWPNGIVVGNLLASIIWMGIMERQHHKRHEELMRHLRIQRKAPTRRKTPEDGEAPETVADA